MPKASIGKRPAWNVVYAQHKTRAGLLSALKQGHSYVSAQPSLQLEASDGRGNTWMMGDTITSSDPITIQVNWEDVPDGAYIQLKIDGNIQRLEEASTGSWQDSFDPSTFQWLTLEVWDDAGAWAFTNPLYGTRLAQERN